MRRLPVCPSCSEFQHGRQPGRQRRGTGSSGRRPGISQKTKGRISSESFSTEIFIRLEVMNRMTLAGPGGRCRDHAGDHEDDAELARRGHRTGRRSCASSGATGALGIGTASITMPSTSSAIMTRKRNTVRLSVTEGQEIGASCWVTRRRRRRARRSGAPVASSMPTTALMIAL